MKTKCLLFLFITFSFVSFAKAISFKGTILNATDNEIVINGLEFKKNIKLNTDGSFFDALDIKHNGLYTFINGKNRWEIYLDVQADLEIFFDEENIDETIFFKGITAQENTYLFKKNKLYSTENFKPTFIYLLKEAEFVALIEQVTNTNLNLLKSFNNVNETFKKIEEKNIIFSNQNYYSSYKFSHSYYTKTNVQNAKICASKIIKRDTLNFDDFKFSTVFRNYAFGKFSGAFRHKFEKKPALVQQHLQEELQKINNPVIENYILQNLSVQTNFYNDKDDLILQAIISITNNKELKEKLTLKLENKETFVNGSQAPKFELLDQNGNAISLDSFKGKNIYIDFWATWCKPCVAEIPDLKKLEEKFKSKNIVFLSISIDSPKDFEKWKNFIVKKDLGGIQLIAENAWDSQIVKQYMVESIPRFVLIDTEGNLVDINAPRPSEAKIYKAINRLDKL